MVGKSAKDAPGPGQYSDNREFGRNAPAVQIQGKGNDQVREDRPGPG